MKKLVLFTILPIFLLSPSLVFSQTRSSDAMRRTPGEIRNEVREKVKDRLDSRRLKLCEVKEKVIKNRTESLTRLVLNMEDKFASISARVQKYYTEKLVPEGKTVSNYDALVSDIDAKKAALDSALSNAQSDSSNFACDSDNPKGKLKDFREDMQEVKSALHEYRLSIKNLIVAVRGIVGEG